MHVPIKGSDVEEKEENKDGGPSWSLSVVLKPLVSAVDDCCLISLRSVTLQRKGAGCRAASLVGGVIDNLSEADACFSLPLSLSLITSLVSQS